MPFTIPPAINYSDTLIPKTVTLNNPNIGQPTDGTRMIPVEIDWGTMGGASYCVMFNLANLSVNNFSGMQAISVDNSSSGSDIIIVFTDTMETTQVPAYTPKAIVPVFTGSSSFYVIATKPLPIDVTRMSIMNFCPPPAIIPISKEQAFATVSGIAMVAGTTHIIPASVSGTLQNGFIGFFAWSNNAETGVFTLNDGAGTLIAGAKLGLEGGHVVGYTAWEATDINVRFSGGITLTCDNGIGNDGSLSVNLYYRTP